MDRIVPPAATISEAELAIVGGETSEHTVPLGVLVRSLDGLQRIVFLVAAADERRPIGERFVMTETFRERHSLRCGVPGASRFALPLILDSAFPGVSATTPLARTLELFRAVAVGGWSEFTKIVPDPQYLPRILAELQAMLPRSGDRWALSLNVAGEYIVLDAKVNRRVRDYISPPATEDVVTTVTGELVRVDFDKSRIVVRYAPTGREIPCFCELSVLDGLVQDWFMPIQVTGRFTLDASGNPTKLTRVTRVETVDLSPLTFDHVEWGGRRLVIDPALTLAPELDEESGQFYVLTDENLGIDVFARTREQVADELAEQLMFQWDAYARETPERLTSSARRLRESLRERMREADIAAQP